MRITQNAITRRYTKNLNDNLANLSKANSRIASGRQYTRLSENVGSGMRALKIRRDLSEIQQQQANVRDARGYISSTESNLRSINDVVVTAYEKSLRGMNGDKLTDDIRATVAKELEGLKSQILQFANSQFAGSFLLSGTNNSTQPFTTDANGRLLYNGVSVDSVALNRDSTIDSQYVENGDHTKPVTIPFDDPLYIDLGMGMKMGGQTVDPRTAFQVSFSGMKIFGCGTVDGTATGVSNNLYNLINDLQTQFDPTKTPNFDMAKVSTLVDQLEVSRSDFFGNISDLGNRDKYLETVDIRLENDYGNLIATRSELEGVNDTAETMNIKMYEYCWLATLKMGSKILPQSLMDYIS